MEGKLEATGVVEVQRGQGDNAVENNRDGQIRREGERKQRR